jgi:hypothetical protein
MKYFSWKARTFVAAALSAAIALVLAVGQATATVIEHRHFSGTDSASFDDCGFTLQVESEFSGELVVRADKGGEVFLKVRREEFRDVVTNPATGLWFVIRGHVLLNETKATLVSGTVYEVVSVEAGQPFEIVDSAGNVIVLDRGMIRQTYLFETLGDGQPSGDVVAITDVVAHGLFPGFDADFCAIAAELTGA